MIIQRKINKKRKEGVVVSDKSNKTVVVLVKRFKKQPRYKKQYKVSKKYKAYDKKNEYKVRDEVVIEEIRPLSKEKRWRVVKKIKSSSGS
jgi:small subunit ribosomal protein S17